MSASALVAVLAAATLQLATVTSAMAEEAAKKPAASGPVDSIEVAKSTASWDNLSELFLGTTPAAPFGEGSMFVMRGELHNRGDRPVRYVVLRYELLDAAGKVLLDVEGFNRSAESMRPDEEGKVHAENVKTLPAGGVDSYRMVFFHDEVPRFASQRVRVVEVHTEDK